MTKKLNKRGFTIVELVVVIVVIAILAAVLIPTVSSLIDKANQSADTAAVRQMNEQLAITEVEGKPANIGAAIKALLGVNIKLENYTPLATNTQFYWVKSLNRVVYVNIEDGKEEIIYPTDLQSLKHTFGDWYSLNGDIEFENYTVADDKSVAITSAGQFAQLTDKKADGISTVNITNDIDLSGATAKITAAGTGRDTGFNSTITIDGSNNGTNSTIYGLRDDTLTSFGSGEFANKGYGYGLFGNIGADGEVTIKNVVFDGITVEDTISASTGTAGLIAGYIYGKLTLENVTFRNCSVTAYQKVGGIVGQLYGTLSMTNVTFENCVVSGEIEVAKIVGTVQNGALTVSNCQLDGLTTKSVSAKDTFVKADIEKMIVSKKHEFTLYGQESNTFIYLANKSGFYNSVTNDWAWYLNTRDNEDWNLKYREQILTYQGQDRFLQGTSSSASVNFVNGAPQR